MTRNNQPTNNQKCICICFCVLVGKEFFTKDDNKILFQLLLMVLLCLHFYWQGIKLWLLFGKPLPHWLRSLRKTLKSPQKERGVVLMWMLIKKAKVVTHHKIIDWISGKVVLAIKVYIESELWFHSNFHQPNFWFTESVKVSLCEYLYYYIDLK